jgi:prepilin signal peptidase PulO-like enzyme (type II secretory pathway)
MMFALPLGLRLAVVFATGVLVATQLNRGIYRLAWHARPVGPWSLPSPAAPPRRWYDRLPVLGWFWLRREAALHGPWFWVRPLLIELCTGLGLAGLYWYEVDRGGVWAWRGLQPDIATLHAQFFSHAVLIALMIVATFIDFDEQTIPDAITVPGALLGLALAGVLPGARPLVTLPAAVGFRVDHLHLASAAAWPGQPDWPQWLNGKAGLCLGLLALLAWWLSVLPWTWTVRRGLAKGVQFFFASLWRHTPWLMPLLAAAGAAGVSVSWMWGGDRWESMLSALVGMVFGGGLIWAVRIVGTRALGQEAMGFGDVTLMAMIGAFMGWQAILMIFFLAPVAALAISLTQWLLTRRKDIAFGPYLCLATLLVILRWGWLWERFGRPIFSLGWFVPAMVAGCVALIWALLTLMRALRGY